MRYQVILSISGPPPVYDKITALEDGIMEELGPDGEFDGNEIGPQDMSFFIYTDTPREAIEKAELVLRRFGCTDFESVTQELIEKEEA
jgi:hypothetical protein